MWFSKRIDVSVAVRDDYTEFLFRDKYTGFVVKKLLLHDEFTNSVEMFESAFKVYASGIEHLEELIDQEIPAYIEDNPGG